MKNTKKSKKIQMDKGLSRWLDHKIEQGISLTMKCSCLDCLNQADTCLAIGFSRKKPKMAFTIRENRLNRILNSNALAVPVCDEHKALIKRFFKAW